MWWCTKIDKYEVWWLSNSPHTFRSKSQQCSGGFRYHLPANLSSRLSLESLSVQQRVIRFLASYPGPDCKTAEDKIALNSRKCPYLLPRPQRGIRGLVQTLEILSGMPIIENSIVPPEYWSCILQSGLHCLQVAPEKPKILANDFCKYRQYFYCH